MTTVVERMTSTITTGSWVEKLQFAQTEGLHALEYEVLDFVRAKLKKCCARSNFKALSADQVRNSVVLTLCDCVSLEFVLLFGVFFCNNF